MQHLTCETCQVATLEVDALTGETLHVLDEEGWRFIHIKGRPPRAFCPTCVEQARRARTPRPSRLTQHEAMSARLERLLSADTGTHRSDRRPGFLLREEREALSYALGVLHERMCDDDIPF